MSETLREAVVEKAEKRGMRRERLDINNGGYSLIELIIVMAIISAIMGAAFYSISLIFGANARACANNIQRAIAECKVTAMGQAEAWMELYRDDDKNVYTQMYRKDAAGNASEKEPQKVGTSRVEVSYIKDGAETLLAPGNKVEIRFDRANGGFAPPQGGGEPCAEIHVRGGGKHYRITLIKLTGKIEVKAVADP